MSLRLSCWSPSVLPASSGIRTSKLGLLLGTQSELSFGVLSLLDSTGGECAGIRPHAHKGWTHSDNYPLWLRGSPCSALAACCKARGWARGGPRPQHGPLCREEGGPHVARWGEQRPPQACGLSLPAKAGV